MKIIFLKEKKINNKVYETGSSLKVAGSMAESFISQGIAEKFVEKVAVKKKAKAKVEK